MTHLRLGLSRLELPASRFRSAPPCAHAQGKKTRKNRRAQAIKQVQVPRRPWLRSGSACGYSLEPRSTRVRVPTAWRSCETRSRPPWAASGRTSWSSAAGTRSWTASHRRTLESYPGRYVVEQTFGLLDQFRRIRSRYEALVRNFKSMHHIA